MPIVENIALQKCGVRAKDNWNPADIYIVKKTEEKQIVKELESIGGLETDKELKLDRLNEYMRELFVKRHLVVFCSYTTFLQCNVFNYRHNSCIS